jgi:hypothetical protein
LSKILSDLSREEDRRPLEGMQPSTAEAEKAEVYTKTFT